jgi:hypothetical protein
LATAGDERMEPSVVATFRVRPQLGVGAGSGIWGGTREREKRRRDFPSSLSAFERENEALIANTSQLLAGRPALLDSLSNRSSRSKLQEWSLQH